MKLSVFNVVRNGAVEKMSVFNVVRNVGVRISKMRNVRVPSFVSKVSARVVGVGKMVQVGRDIGTSGRDVRGSRN